MLNKSLKYCNPVIIILLVIAQLYFSIAAGKYSETETDDLQTINETYLTSSFDIYTNEANLNNKIASSEKVLSSRQLPNDNFYTTVLTIAEELGRLYFINSENNPNYLLSVIIEKTVPRSPPLT
jgi:hypothetical protein